MPSMKPRVTYDTVKQGIEELWSAKNPDVDIVAVPGLGSDPVNCWASSGHPPFNWLTDKEGLMKDFKHSNTSNAMTSARLLLYHSESAWLGRLKVRAELHDLAYALLVALRTDRQDKRAERRPLVFIAHSMGGLVVAKAICIAFSQKEEFPLMFETITGALFFGTPFRGTPLALAASLVDTIGSRLNLSARTSLLEFMKPESPGLKELKDEFLGLAKHSSVGANMHLVCFFEQHSIDLEKIARKRLGVPINLNTLSTQMVKEESAALGGYDCIPLARNHSTMVTFNGSKDPEYQLVRDTVWIAVRKATDLANARLLAVR